MLSIKYRKTATVSFANPLRVFGQDGKEAEAEREDIVEEDVADAAKFGVLGDPVIGKEVETCD